MSIMGSDFYPSKTQHRPHQFLRHSSTLGPSVLFAFPKAGAISVPLGWGSSIMLAYRFLLSFFPSALSFIGRRKAKKIYLTQQKPKRKHQKLFWIQHEQKNQ